MKIYSGSDWHFSRYKKSIGKAHRKYEVGKNGQ